MSVTVQYFALYVEKRSGNKEWRGPFPTIGKARRAVPSWARTSVIVAPVTMMTPGERADATAILGHWAPEPVPRARSGKLYPYLVTSDLGIRTWQAEDEDHAREQHEDAFPDELVTSVTRRDDPPDRYHVENTLTRIHASKDVPTWDEAAQLCAGLNDLHGDASRYGVYDQNEKPVPDDPEKE